MTLEDACARFVEWLDECVLSSGRGDHQEDLISEPKDVFWLGLLYPEESVLGSALDIERAGRLAPCSIGMRLRPRSGHGPWTLSVRASVRVWARSDQDRPDTWIKSDCLEVVGDATLLRVGDAANICEADFAKHFAKLGVDLRAKIQVSVEDWRGLPVLVARLINCSPEQGDRRVARELYEVSLEVTGPETAPFEIDPLPDSFRYDRRINAYGENCGVVFTDGSVRSTDAVVVERGRPRFWGQSVGPEPDLTFSRLSRDPLPPLRQLADAFRAWTERHWSHGALRDYAKQFEWSEEMFQQAATTAARAQDEVTRLERGLHALEDPDLRRAFMLMNEAIYLAAQDRTGRSRYERWRPFQIGFLLTMLECLLREEPDDGVVDTVWFATGGGKTETYLGLIVTAVLLDRIKGRKTGTTAWARFPLRMLSLQQTQRFANAAAAAEMLRQRKNLGGAPISLGFFVGSGSSGTPNRIPLEPKSDGDFDVEDDHAADRYQVLLECPFCHWDSLTMGFNRRKWLLEHRCSRRGQGCPWAEEALPFFIVDDEIFRFLPSVLVGTVDKAALVSMQKGMVGLFGPPSGWCSRGHGHTYAKRSTSPNGCLVPGCTGEVGSLPQSEKDYGLTFRLQDELHLLRDSLGAVDAHYESLLDFIQRERVGRTPKIISSSATLAGHDRQCEVLFQRGGRVFPEQGVRASESFWSQEDDPAADRGSLLRRFVAFAPRGATQDFVTDRIVETLQRCIRMLVTDPDQVLSGLGIDRRFADDLISLYGVNVLYGTTLRDVEAAHRSMETQLRLDGPVVVRSLTGGTPLAEVRDVLDRLNQPEPTFDERIHIIAASSMLSHGVDVDRLNTMVMVGMPLTASEFIQTTARVGRRYPGLVYVLNRMGREREASLYRDFEPFVRQGDRFVEPVAVTRRSRRVADLTLPGIAEAGRLMVDEPRARRPLTTLRTYLEYIADGQSDEGYVDKLGDDFLRTLSIDETTDAALAAHVRQWVVQWQHLLRHPPADAKFPSDALPQGIKPMRSLRDVEETAPIKDVTQQEHR